jgi:DNA-binding SARP family transcriptional activator/tetratricopeptide (TPR) repeat protein
MRVEFRLLGGVEATVDGVAVDIGHARQQCVLVALLLDANTVVTVDQLIDRVWADWPPVRARGTLSSYLTRLRTALGVPITRRAGGYVLTVDDDAVDLHRFRRLTARARAAADDATALALWDEAFALWRGEPFVGLDNPWLATVRTEWERSRLAAELDHVDTALRCGRHAELVAALSSSVERRPLDERLAGQLMVALYRSGRQADALAHYRSIRTRLADELGAEPGPRLRELHQQILTADPVLAAPVSTPTPRQLPAAPRQFTGRTHELELLDGAPMSAVVGPGGIGKTWLALHWAHRHADRFPDGQLYVDLRGFDTAIPTPPAVAVRGFLDALGVAPAAIPADVAAQCALYRSLVAGKRMLVVLDNARDTEQIAPLLPGSPGCVVLVTSRRYLGGLVSAHGARVLSLDVFTDAEARDLLANHVGASRVAAEPAAVADLTAYCAGLPLAIGIVAARAVNHPHFPLRVLAADLRDRAGRLDALDVGEASASLRSVFSWTYDALSPEAATLFGLLGVAPGQDIGLPAAASLAALPASRVGLLLRELETAHLVRQPEPGRYRMHDLVRLYAAEQAGAADEALHRMVHFYLHTAEKADRLMNPHRPTIAIDAPPRHVVPFPIETRAEALAWLTTERGNLLATQQVAVDHDWHGPVWGLAWYVRTLLWRQGYLWDNLATWQAGVRAADHLGDLVVRSLAHRHLADAHTLLRQHMTALVRHRYALVLAERADSREHQGHTHWGLAWSFVQQGNHERGLHHATKALRLYEAHEQPWRRADALNAMGWCHAWLGNHDDARACCEQALELFRQHGVRTGEVRTLDSLGFTEHGAGNYPKAVEHYRQALALCRELGWTYDEADTYSRLGETYTALGQHEQARAAWREALTRYETQHRSKEAARVSARLAAL